MRPSDDINKLIKKMKLKASANLDKRVHDKISNAPANIQSKQPAHSQPAIWRIPLWIKAGYLAASFLVIVSFVISFVLYGKVVNLRNKLELAQQDIVTTPIDDSVTINFYLKEHQDFIARQASLNSAASQQIQMQVSPDDLLYYEFLVDELEFMRPGIIVRGPSSQQEIDSSESPTISNGYILTFSEAQEATDFDIISPSWFHPCYKLGQFRIIEGRDALQLLYTNGINSISLFEQSLDGQNGLSHQDFREYAVYNNKEEGGGTILAWRDDTLSYVLIGNIEMSQLMNMAQSISATK